MLKLLQYSLHGCLDLFLPERCVLCDRQVGDEADPLPAGPRVRGLRVWDRPHLCRTCYASLQGNCPQRCLRGAGDQVVRAGAGLVTNARLVKLVGALKYHGLRGVAWPLASLVAQAQRQVVTQEVDYLVAVPLHPARRRERGFNQADLLARLLAHECRLDYRPDLLSRQHPTRQQAKLSSCFDVRFANVQRAFCAQAVVARGAERVGLVDDIITSGATILAAATALTRAGWQVPWALAAGMSAS